MNFRLQLLICVSVTAFGLTAGHCALGGHKPAKTAVDVPPVDELTILDPRVDAEGKPHPVVTTDIDQKTHVDVPPTVIVHNYYYTGDRDFRAPRLTGGPVILVLNDPNTGERLYLEAQLPAGSPRVIYRQHSIEYDFGHEKVRVKFGHKLLFANHHPKVHYKESDGEALESRSRAAAKPIYAQQFEHMTHSVSQGTKTVLQNVGGAIQVVGTQVSAPFIQVVHATPVGRLFEERPEDQAVLLRDQAVQQAAAVQQANNLTIPTNR